MEAPGVPCPVDRFIDLFLPSPSSLAACQRPLQGIDLQGGKGGGGSLVAPVQTENLLSAVPSGTPQVEVRTPQLGGLQAALPVGPARPGDWGVVSLGCAHARGLIVRWPCLLQLMGTELMVMERGSGAPHQRGTPHAPTQYKVVDGVQVFFPEVSRSTQTRCRLGQIPHARRLCLFMSLRAWTRPR